MIKKFEEFVNEGLISDYKKQKEAENKEIGAGDKKFIVDLLKEFGSIGISFVFSCKNYAVSSDENVVDDYLEHLRNKTMKVSELEDFDINELHITENSVLVLSEDGDDEWVDMDGEFKNIWKKVYDWFAKKYEKDEEIEFTGKVRVKYLISMKADIKKDLL